ncbi:MAG: cell division protein ZapE [Nitratireductor sp.]
MNSSSSHSPGTPFPGSSISTTGGASVRQAYDRLVAGGSVEHDRAQIQLAERLDALAVALESRQLSKKSSSLGWLFNRRTRTSNGSAGVRGLYIHGRVGRGKSMLMDLFFTQVQVRTKRRAHFNEFMQDVHSRIHAHRQAYQRGETREEDPIGPVAREIADQASLLCFDEFTVTDITDAMILGRLFTALFEKCCVLVATSNIEPDGLYHNGLNRQLFLPFIELLKQRVDVFELDARTDFRLEKLGDGKSYLSPLGQKAEAGMDRLWQMVAAGREVEEVELSLKGRKLRIGKTAGDTAWLGFDQLCVEARGAGDYLALAARFDTLFLHDVPMMDQSMRNQAKRFILLIDTLYDTRVRLILSAAANPHALYQGTSGNEVFEFQRTASRLIEMQSAEYLARSGPVRDKKHAGRQTEKAEKQL